VTAYIVDAVRSPIGRKNGTLAAIRGDDLAAQVLNGLIRRHDLDPAEIEDVQMGCVTQIGEQGWNVGRMAVLAAGWPVEVSATTVDRQCGSSMQTNFNAAAAVMAGQLDVVVSAGVEMMSRVPMGSNGGPISEEVTERHEIVIQGTSAELLAEEWKLTREELDAYSLESHRRAIAASDSGKFEGEIIPIELPETEGGGGVATRTVFKVDEAARRETSLEALAALKPAFRPDGVVTAGNSSQIVDGSAAVLIASEPAVQRLGLTPRARFVSFGIAGVDPTRMLHGNPQAMEKALAKAGLTLDDMGVIEVNEAFATVVLQTAKDLHLEERMDDVNPNGGGISLGHPLGATGARITATLLPELERRGARYGIASMCVGFGMAIAGVVERV
jgi:acetyl-CoA acyltransferase